MMKRPTIAITMGDPAGIGPEIIIKALQNQEILERCQPIIIGSEQALRRAQEFTNVSIEWQQVPKNSPFSQLEDGISLINDESSLHNTIPIGEIDAACGASAFNWLSRAIQLAMDKKVDAIVTCPLHKEALNKAGYHYAGHTEILAEQTHTKHYTLMLTAGNFRVAHVTCHVAQKSVSSQLSVARVENTIRLFSHALKRLNGGSSRIAVCALNPHGGEGGLFGDEEIRFIQPAVENCAREGLDVEGPFPSDSIYPQLIGGKYDGVVAMYHDQGHIAFKMANFTFNSERQEWETVTGVNITLGLPILRTSVDHGTAFDLAGTGKASERSLLDAIEAALKLSQED